MVAFLVALILYGNVQFANGMYLKKDLEQGAYMSYMTRVVDRIEEHEEYIAGETSLCFVGTPENLYYSPNGFDEYSEVIGMKRAVIPRADERRRYDMLFGYLLGVPVKLAEEDIWDSLQNDEEVSQMPIYPDSGSLKMIGDVLVIKLGD